MEERIIGLIDLVRAIAGIVILTVLGVTEI